MRLPSRWALAGKKLQQTSCNRLGANLRKRLLKRNGRLAKQTALAALAMLGVCLLCWSTLYRRRKADDAIDDDDDGDDDEYVPPGFGLNFHERFDPRRVARARAKWRAPPPHDGFSEELWSRIKDDVVLGVKTGHEVARKRLKKLRDSGWFSVGREIPNVLIISDQDDDELGVVGIKSYAYDLLHSNATRRSGAALTDGKHPVSVDSLPSHWFERTGWRGDKDKNLPALHLLRTAFPNKKWYLLLDDDTYIFLENFARYVSDEDMNDRPIYTGKVFYISRCGGFTHDGSFAANRSAPKGMFAHGGSGIVLNGIAMEHLFPQIRECIHEFSSCWAGDMQVGLCMRKIGVQLLKHGGMSSYEKHFIPFWPSKALSDRRYSARWKSEDEPVTFHKIPDHEQELMSQFERKVAADGKAVVYDELREHLIDNGIVPCHTEHNKKLKWYSREFMPAGFKD